MTSVRLREPNQCGHHRKHSLNKSAPTKSRRASSSNSVRRTMSFRQSSGASRGKEQLIFENRNQNSLVECKPKRSRSLSRDILKISNIDETNTNRIQSKSTKISCSPSVSQTFKLQSKIFSPKIILLDGKEMNFDIHKNDTARILLNKVCNYLHIREKIFFGLYFRDTSNRKIWLNLSKSLNRQIKNHDSTNWIFVFRLKFYPPDISMINDKMTFYYVSLQLRNDILSQKLTPSFNILVAMCAYVVQAEVGDYNPEIHKDSTGYIEGFNFIKNQNHSFLQRIALTHRSLSGLESTDADKCLLQLAMCLNQYGQHTQLAIEESDSKNVILTVNPSGMAIMQQNLTLHNFPWQQILKIKSSRRLFIIQAISSNLNNDANSKNRGKFTKGNSSSKEINQNSNVKTFTYRLKDEKTNDSFLSLVIEHHIFFRIRNENYGQPYQTEYRATKSLEELNENRNPMYDVDNNNDSNSYLNVSMNKTSKKSKNRSSQPNHCSEEYMYNSYGNLSTNSRMNASVGSFSHEQESEFDNINHQLAHSSAIYEYDLKEEKILPIIIESVDHIDQTGFSKINHPGEQNINDLKTSRFTNRISNLCVETNPITNSITSNSSDFLKDTRMSSIKEETNLNIPIKVSKAQDDINIQLLSNNKFNSTDEDIIKDIEKKISNYKFANDKVENVKSIDMKSKND